MAVRCEYVNSGHVAFGYKWMIGSWNPWGRIMASSEEGNLLLSIGNHFPVTVHNFNQTRNMYADQRNGM